MAATLLWPGTQGRARWNRDWSNRLFPVDLSFHSPSQGLISSVLGHAAPIREIATSPNVSGLHSPLPCNLLEFFVLCHRCSGFLTATEDKTARYWHYS
ncbi:hypothetical protein Zmor_008877 [Zophobas morio]|uniref:Uncharacterized protein n=1 Tax=Zophobas morio TaxID=2755281 RepID=A0AA38HHB9_9CUCU|nr:hypothetical protein Zmor_008877 [Zophobas morio]